MKAYIDAAVKVLIIAALGAFILISCAKIGERLDAQAKAEADYIENYKAELKAEQTKD